MVARSALSVVSRLVRQAGDLGAEDGTRPLPRARGDGGSAEQEQQYAEVDPPRQGNTPRCLRPASRHQKSGAAAMMGSMGSGWEVKSALLPTSKAAEMLAFSSSLGSREVVSISHRIRIYDRGYT